MSSMFLQNLSKFISSYRYEQATDESIATVKAAFLDFFGVTYRGMDQEASKIAFATVNEIYSGDNNPNLKASIIKKAMKTDVLSAAFLNAIAAHVLELDDGHRLAQIHLGTIIFPTALAIAESHDLSGKEFIESVIVGYETGILLGKIVNPQHRNRGFHTTGTVGTFIAGAVASKLLNLDEDEILNTLGLCGTQAAGLLESDHGGSMGKVLHVGKAVHNGILSAFLAKNNFTGSETIFDGKEGFLNSMVFDNSDFEEDGFSFEDAIKDVSTINIQDIYFKKYPFCRHIHSSIDSALKLKSSIGDEYEHIESITIKTYDIACQHNNFEPKTLEQLRQSLPYAVAIALVCGEADVDKIDELIKYGLLRSYSISDEVDSIKELAYMINIVSDDELNRLYPNKRPSNIIIRLDEDFRNGVFQNTTLLPKGDFENPLKLQDLIDKFKQLNPDYNIKNLTVIDNLEEQSMVHVVEKLNEQIL